MTRSFSHGWIVGALLAMLPAVAVAASPEKKTAKEPENVVELFAGMESGEIEVKVFPKDATKGTVTIKNNTDKPLTIKVPEAIAGVPVLGQLGCGGLCGGGGGNNGGGNQGFGGGMMGGGMMGGMGGMGGGFFNVAPDKVAKVKLITVCLDHGKEDPNPHIEYKLVPIESYAKDPAVTEVIKQMVAGKLDQHSAQAAAWHLQNGLTWQELATKVGAKHLNGTIDPYFTPVHLTRALAATKEAQKRAAASEDKPARSPGESVAAQE